MADPNQPLQNIEDAEAAFNQFWPMAEKLDAKTLNIVNTDIVLAASVMQGHIDRLMPFHERFLKLPEFDNECLLKVTPLARAAWFAHVTNLPEADASELPSLFAEVVAHRTK